MIVKCKSSGESPVGLVYAFETETLQLNRLSKQVAAFSTECANVYCHAFRLAGEHSKEDSCRRINDSLGRITDDIKRFHLGLL